MHTLSFQAKYKIKEKKKISSLTQIKKQLKTHIESDSSSSSSSSSSLESYIEDTNIYGKKGATTIEPALKSSSLNSSFIKT